MNNKDDDEDLSERSREMADMIKELQEQQARENAKPFSYYEKLRKKSGERYLDPKTEQQMVRDYQILGDAFEDGKFNDPQFGPGFH